MSKFKHSAALLLCLAGLGSGAAIAQSLILKNPTTGSTLVQYPLATSASCVLTGTGDIEVRPQPAGGTAGDGWCPQGAAPTPPTFPGPLTVTPSAIITGNTVSASWTSSGATGCSGSATRNGGAVTVSGWSGAQPTSQTGLQFTPPTAGAYVFTITCTNTAGSTPSSSATINVTDPGTGACAGVLPTFAGQTRQITFNNTTALKNEANDDLPLGPVDIRFWSPFFGLQFPETRGDNAILPAENGKYVAFEFNTGAPVLAPDREGQITWVPPSSNEGQVLVAITECPGDFTNLPPGSASTNGNAICRGPQNGTGAVIWVIEPSSNPTSNFVCHLQENTTYYVNVTYTNFSTGLSTCAVPDSTGACHWLETIR